MLSRRSIGLLFVALLVLASGCGALLGGDPDGDTVANETAAAIESVDSYTYDSTVTLQQNGTNDSIEGAGVVDRADRRLRFEQSIGDQSAVQYIVEDTIYQNTSGSWQSAPLGNDSFWSDQLPLAGQRSILEGANATLVGETTVNGTAVDELSVDVTDRQLLGYLRQRLPAISPGITFSNVSYTVYVTPDDRHLERVTTDATASVGDQHVDVSSTMNVGGYDENVTVDLPPAIEQDQ